MAAPGLGRELAAALMLKLVLLTLIYLLFFRGDQQPVIDAREVARHVLSPAASARAATVSR